jgi:hypothetical protein
MRTETDMTEVGGTMTDIEGSIRDLGLLMYVSLLPPLTSQHKFTIYSNRDAIEIEIEKGTETETEIGMEHAGGIDP